MKYMPSYFWFVAVGIVCAALTISQFVWINDLIYSRRHIVVQVKIGKSRSLSVEQIFSWSDWYRMDFVDFDMTGETIRHTINPDCYRVRDAHITINDKTRNADIYVKSKLLCRYNLTNHSLLRNNGTIVFAR